MNKAKFEDIIQDKGVLIYTSVGDSMYPLIKKGDLLVIRAVNAPLKKYDIPLYKRDSGQYVLHRIIKVRKNDYLICGDNRCLTESGITDRHVVGVLTAVIRDGREIPVTNWCCRLYAHLWCDLFPVRALILRIRHVLKRLTSRHRSTKV